MKEIENTRWPFIILKNYGPFKEARLTLKPINILVGKNGSGKSLLLYTSWMLASLVPNLSILYDRVIRSREDLINNTLTAIERNDKNILKESLKELLNTYFMFFPESVSEALKEKIIKTFGMEPRNLIRKGMSEAEILLKGHNIGIEIRISENKVESSFTKETYEYFQKLIDNIEIEKYGTTDEVKIATKFHESRKEVRSTEDLHDLITGFLAYLFAVNFNGVFLATPVLSHILVDGRAGLSRAFLKPYTVIGREQLALEPDLSYIKLYYKLAEDLYKGRISINKDLGRFLHELNVKGVEASIEKGSYNIYLRMANDVLIPFELAPSGVRETLLIVLSIISKAIFKNIFIEEPESHLHPRAIRELVRIIVRNQNDLNTLMITTHSPYFLYSINIHIMLSKYDKNKRIELGYRHDEAIRPEAISAYLVKVEDEYSVLEELEISENGIDESDFTKVVEELADEKFKLT